MEQSSVRHNALIRWGLEGSNDRTAFFAGTLDLVEMPLGVWMGVAQIDCPEEATTKYRADVLIGEIIFEVRLDDGRISRPQTSSFYQQSPNYAVNLR